jgi:hypothetical protein
LTLDHGQGFRLCDMNVQTAQHITIGAVARRAGVGIDTIRYY